MGGGLSEIWKFRRLRPPHRKKWISATDQPLATTLNLTLTPPLTPTLTLILTQTLISILEPCLLILITLLINKVFIYCDEIIIINQWAVYTTHLGLLWIFLVYVITTTTYIAAGFLRENGQVNILPRYAMAIVSPKLYFSHYFKYQIDRTPSPRKSVPVKK